MEHACVVPDNGVADYPLMAMDAVGSRRPGQQIIEEGAPLVAKRVIGGIEAGELGLAPRFGDGLGTEDGRPLRRLAGADRRRARMIALVGDGRTGGTS
jgi:hypothetical protein